MYRQRNGCATVKVINNLRGDLKESLTPKITKAEKKEMKAAGIKLSDKKAVEAYLAEKKQKEDEAKAAAEAEAAEKARLEREANPTTEDLLKAILAQLKKD